MTKRIIVFLMIMVFFISIKEAQAADDKTLENIFKNAYYGALIGGLLGTAILVFSDRPADHFDYIAYGMAGGIIAGTFYGMAYSQRSLSDIDHGRIKFDFPRLELKYNPQLDPSERNRPVLSLPLVKFHF